MGTEGTLSGLRSTENSMGQGEVEEEDSGVFKQYGTEQD